MGRRLGFTTTLLVAGALALGACGADDDAAGPEAPQEPGGEAPAAAAGDVERTDAPPSDAEVCDRFEEPERTSDDPLQWAAAPELAIEADGTYDARVATSKGELTIRLSPDESPVAVNNFIFLACQGFYSDVPIHRVVDGFVFQTGDPTGTGTGGPGYTIEDERAQGPYDRGTVSMARTPAPNSAGSQWFVALDAVQLPPDYARFGEVTEGMDVVDVIGSVATTTAPSGEPSQPVDPLTVYWVQVTAGA